MGVLSLVLETAGFQKLRKLPAPEYDFTVSQDGMKENDFIRPQIVRHLIRFFGGKKTDAVGLVERHQLF